METGHNKNVANFETIIIILVGLGAVYTPGQALILLPALQAKLTAAKAALADVDEADAAKKIDVNARQAEFDGIEEYAVNIKRTAEVLVNDAAFTAELQSVVRKFRGSRAPGAAKPVDDPATPDVNEAEGGGHSVSQRSYDNLVSHFAEMIALLKTQAAYTPGDSEYKIDTLEAKLAALEAKNNAAKASAFALGAAQDARDAELYDEATGVIKLVKLIKLQLAVKPGKNSAAYQQVNALEFRKG